MGSSGGHGSYVATAGASNGSDDTTTLQALLTAARTAGGGLVKGKPGASYLISAPLVVGSGTVLDMVGCTVTLIAASNSNMLRNYAMANPNRTIADAAITAAATTLTSATAAFTSADVGRTVVITGAGPGGAVLVANITAYTNGTTVTVGTAASTTVSGAAASIYTRDTNIAVLGGTWARGANAGTANNLHSLFFRHIDGLTIRSEPKFSSSAGKYAIDIGDATKVLVDSPDFATFSDGIHLSGPITNATIRAVRGTTGDDTVALTARDYATYEDTLGDITDVVIEDVRAASTAALVKVLGGTGVKLRAITLRDIAGTSGDWGIAVVDDTLGTTDIAGLLIDRVSLLPPNGKPIMDLSAGAGKDCAVRDVYYSGSGTPASALIKIANWTMFSLDGFKAPHGALNFNAVATTGTLTEVSLKNIQINGGDTSAVIGFNIANAITRVTIADAHLINCRSLFDVSAAVGSIIVANTSLSGTNRLSNVTATTVVTLNGVSFAGLLNAAFFVNGATLTVRGAGIHEVNAITGFQRAAAETIRLFNPDYPADFALLQKQADSAGINRNAGLACGTGRAVCDGTNWKNLVSGLTY